MDERKERELNNYLDLLFWMETASSAEIQGTLAVASGVTKEDLHLAVKCMMESYRPDLARYFPHLKPNRSFLAELRCQHAALAEAMQLLEDSLTQRKHDPSLSLEGYDPALL
ncbi:hypothetical protein D3C84_942970 [compost metagenome]